MHSKLRLLDARFAWCDSRSSLTRTRRSGMRRDYVAGGVRRGSGSLSVISEPPWLVILKEKKIHHGD